MRILAYHAEASHWSEDLTSLHEAEAGRDHPIDVASRRLAVGSMRRLALAAPTILDVGCSSGFVVGFPMKMTGFPEELHRNQREKKESIWNLYPVFP